MVLSAMNLEKIIKEKVDVPDRGIFELPEKVLQFGTGVLLRGLPDYFIDKANRMGLFNGRIVVVKSTNQGSTEAFERQNGLYTLCIRGIENGIKKEEAIINSSISRVLSAHEEWSEILHCAHSQDMQVILSNTTEIGIKLVPDDIMQSPPSSYPGKLLAFLYERFRAFGGGVNAGMVIIPTELIQDNGKKLETIVIQLARLNNLGEDFIRWLQEFNYFCNSLVDRIVPGRPDPNIQSSIEKELGYADNLLIMAEVYRLWAIEGGDAVKKVLTFAAADMGVIIEPNIDGYRERKLRLLNGTHTLSCGLAFLAGFDTVYEAMENVSMSGFICSVMLNEIAPSIPFGVSEHAAREFGITVLDRFRNPDILHHWINITMQYSTKMKARCIPILEKHYTLFKTVPRLFSLGFAAYLYFIKPVVQKDGKFYGIMNGNNYLIQDDHAEIFYNRWQSGSSFVVKTTLEDSFWDLNLASLPGFQMEVESFLYAMIHTGVKETLHQCLKDN